MSNYTHIERETINCVQYLEGPNKLMVYIMNFEVHCPNMSLDTNISAASRRWLRKTEEGKAFAKEHDKFTLLDFWANVPNEICKEYDFVKLNMVEKEYRGIKPAEWKIV